VRLFMMIKAKKSLGQNFLTSRKVVEDIVNAAEINGNDVILEVGPGKGILTEALLSKAKKVIAMEKDERFAEFLKEKFVPEIENGKLELIFDDILHHQGVALMVGGRYKVVANIPYYITSQFLRNFLSDKPESEQPAMMVLMVQKEVAERIVGTKESLLSISVKVYGRPEIVRKVPAGNFSPKPKVDSAVLKISNISKEFFRDISEENFFEMVKKGFASKRKMLKGNLGVDADFLTGCGVSEKARAEDLSIENWKCLVRTLTNF